MIAAVLSKAWDLYCKSFLRLLAVALLVLVPMTWMLIYLIRENIMLVYENPELAGILCLAVTVIVASFYASVAIYSAHASSLGKPLTLGGAIREGLLSWPWLFGARLALAASIGIGFILLILPGIYLLIRLSLVESMAAVNRAPANETFGRSMEFTKGHFWSILGVFLTMLLIIAPVFWVTEILLESLLLPNSIALPLANSLVCGLITAFPPICGYALYSELTQGSAEIPKAVILIEG